jgi:ParB family chromosome partitioning protein
VVDDEKMQDTAQSIREHGVLVPAIVRPREEGGYEIVAGHRRHHASQIAGLDTMPAIIRDLDDDAATIIMVDSNLQRDRILPSEKGRAYKMKMEALKRQGERTDLTCAPMEHKLEGEKTRDVIAAECGESREQIRRYIRLTYLIPELLEIVDQEKIAFRPAVELSYLTEEEQWYLSETIASEKCRRRERFSKALRRRKNKSRNSGGKNVH